MIYTKLTCAAMRLCFEKHKDQVDKSSIPYVFHPFHVAESMEDEETTVTALLHDVVEDTDTTFEELTALGFPEGVVEALKLLTHEPGIPYFEYVEKIKENPIARAVKMADLAHNSDLSRLETVTRRDLERIEKYKKAMEMLK